MAGAVVHGAHRAGRERISADPVGPLLPVRATAACRTLRGCVRNRSSLRSLCRSFSFAPSGLAQFPLAPHGLRRGLHSYAASRLNAVSRVHFSDDHRAMTQTPPGLESLLPLFPALKRVRENYSFAPLGLHDLPLFTHGLRRGLHSYAASRLKIWSVTPPRRRNSSSHAHTEALRHPKSKLLRVFPLRHRLSRRGFSYRTL